MFQFLIGNVQRDENMTSGMRYVLRFQFLIGKVQPEKKMLEYKIQSDGFQFLIGKVQLAPNAKACSSSPMETAMFQFLIGKVHNGSALKMPSGHWLVSFNSL